MKNKEVRYGKCESCGGKVAERRVTVHRSFHGQLHEFEQVPVGVCRDCGQRLYKGYVLEQLERLARDKGKAKRIIEVPVTKFVPASI